MGNQQREQASLQNYEHTWMIVQSVRVCLELQGSSAAAEERSRTLIETPSMPNRLRPEPEKREHASWHSQHERRSGVSDLQFLH